MIVRDDEREQSLRLRDPFQVEQFLTGHDGELFDQYRQTRCEHHVRCFRRLILVVIEQLQHERHALERILLHSCGFCVRATFLDAL